MRAGAPRFEDEEEEEEAAPTGVSEVPAFEPATAAPIWSDEAVFPIAEYDELRVAELVARGMSNREAAAELFVSVRAVESTLTKIYTKLGIRSRTQLASHLRDQAGQPASGGTPGRPAP